MISAFPNISAHFGRFPVTEISLRNTALAQFDTSRILEAAKLLKDARVDIIVWDGTAAGWRGFSGDEALCQALTAATDLPATTAILGMNEAIAMARVQTLGLFSPYLKDVQERIIQNYRDLGVQVIAEHHLDLKVNFDFSQVPERKLYEMAFSVAHKRPDAIAFYCSNLMSPQLAAPIEGATGIPVFDAMSTAIWKALRMLNVDTSGITGWGSLFKVGRQQG
ncbi:Asp/Glu/hydantoin racemase [Castellaniella sp.]|uniref:maleate cis-trans isomerase family protein n=1 Tax=Castellaniella sp. TaxID=1955812 RepID=UPI00345DC2CE